MERRRFRLCSRSVSVRRSQTPSRAPEGTPLWFPIFVSRRPVQPTLLLPPPAQEASCLPLFPPRVLASSQKGGDRRGCRQRKGTAHNTSALYTRHGFEMLSSDHRGARVTCCSYMCRASAKYGGGAHSRWVEESLEIHMKRVPAPRTRSSPRPISSE